MSLKIALTGEPGVGKSTLVRKVIVGESFSSGGMISQDRRISGRRVGFEICDVGSGALGTLASLDGSGPKFGRYHINLEDLEETGARSIEDAIDSDLLVIDEVGPMELFSKRFVAAVENALLLDRRMLVVLHAKSQHPLAKRIRGTFHVITVTKENRDLLTGEIRDEILRDIRLSDVD
jgi:nucleoside-triphosphatase